MKIALMIILIIGIILFSVSFMQMFKTQKELEEIILKRIKEENKEKDWQNKPNMVLYL